MNILIIGSGGREHALAWKLKQSPRIKQIYVAPGNAGTSYIATNIPISTTTEIVEWTKKNNIDLVIVGPDNYIEEGIVDSFQELNIPVFGPTRLAAEIEWSKAFAKDFMKREDIPTASYEVFTDIESARAYIETQNFPVVIKASGLALGKGVVIAENLDEANKALGEMMESKVFGNAGDQIVIEEFLRGTEISTHAFCDGENAIMFPSSQDHKRIFDGDKGPNTGGMGTIAPVPNISNAQIQEIKEKVVMPTLRGLKKMGREFKGVLFPGIMLTKDGPKVIEFNARFGDPETQSYMRLLESDLVDALFACIDGRLHAIDIRWSDNFASTVVLASKGYPGEYMKGDTIHGLEKYNEIGDDIQMFHAGTKLQDGVEVTNGGRVLGVSAIGSSLKDSMDKAYGAIELIKFDGVQFRKDIGQKSL